MPESLSGWAGNAYCTHPGTQPFTPKGDSMTPDCKLLLSPALYCLPGAPFSWVTRVPRSNTT